MSDRTGRFGLAGAAHERKSFYRLPQFAVRAGQQLRTVYLHLLEPFDYIARLINGKQDLPPLPVRWGVGPLSGQETQGGEFLAYLKILCHLSPQARFLDIGCGYGLMALHLKDYLKDPGYYLGMDINLRYIRWADKSVAKRRPNVRFVHLDVRNSVYNPRGKYKGEEFKFPFDDAAFDCILLKSVFTHMLSKEMENYATEIARLLSRGGVCLATFFLLNDVQAECQRRGLNVIEFAYGDENCRYAWRGSPEAAVAYREDWLKQMLREHGLKVENTYYGMWSGREGGVSYQDILIVKRV